MQAPNSLGDKPPSDSRQVLYFEPQHGSLCGLHALNTMLQSPVYTQDMLESIALELDVQEHQLSSVQAGIGSCGYTPQNMDSSGGMFSLQVLTVALNYYKMSLARLHTIDPRWSPEHEIGYICNLREHWFTIRRVGEEWYDFNSINSAPEKISQFRLAVFLSSLLEEGYDIFIVSGNVPTFPAPSKLGRYGNHGVYMSSDAAASMIANAKAAESLPSSFTSSALSLWSTASDFLQRTLGSEDQDLEDAIQASLSSSSENSAGFGAGTTNRSEQADEQRAIEESRRMYEQQQQQQQQQHGNTDLENALRASMFEK